VVLQSTEVMSGDDYKFNYVIYGAEVSIKAEAAANFALQTDVSGYEVDIPAYKYESVDPSKRKLSDEIEVFDGDSDIYTLKNNKIGSNPFTIRDRSDVSKYRCVDYYEFNFVFSNAYNVTIKQYQMTSASSSATASLYTDRVQLALNLTDTNGDYFARLTSDSTNEVAFDAEAFKTNYIYPLGLDATKPSNTAIKYFEYTKANVQDRMAETVAQGDQLYIYFFIESTTTVLGIYENGKCILTQDEFGQYKKDADGTNPDNPLEFLGDLVIEVEADGTNFSNEADYVAAQSAFQKTFNVYRLTYNKIKTYYDPGTNALVKVDKTAGVVSDISLEVRMSTSIRFQTVIEGFTKESGYYKFGRIFSSEMDTKEAYGGELTGKLIVSQYKVEGNNRDQLLNPSIDDYGNNLKDGGYFLYEDNSTEISEIPAGTPVKYNIIVNEATADFAFVYYYYNKKFDAYPTGNASTIFGFDYGYYTDENGVTKPNRYFYYQEEDVVRDSFNNFVDLKASITADKKYVLIEEVISNKADASISITSTMVENIYHDDGVFRIFAKFAQVVTFTFSKKVYEHTDDSKFKVNAGTNAEFLKYFDAYIVYTASDGSIKNTFISADSNVDTNTITIQKDSPVKLYPYIAPQVENRYMETEVLTIKNFNDNNVLLTIDRDPSGMFVIGTSGLLSTYSKLATE
ncbi:MAG: hypothetical protein J6J33_02135, partial [Clostridia bacterium]|nr:hypothetical protein [Clostridia bacterium]